jgi:uncharacterized protein (DUF1330 family)
MSKQLLIKYFEDEGYVDYGYYLYEDGKVETAYNEQDSRYPIQLVFSSEANALEHYLQTRYNIEVSYE